LFIDFLIFRKSKVKGKKMTGPILDEISVKNQGIKELYFF
jgi:hypothetical protein